ncbi:response regulator transcription factor [Mangrovihabitans endophyticus]|uniref:DNA-binding response regulator n=1 Tax=Mangrovihabitans endophyticus TaxID=1751298 RepID=A0A8J3BSE3_9ACTN|nr:response regulator transcription factor [Mangrovihabitans endophyticus]GGK73371.1 DNA-binding response regulator [Mangrovihabitans endophyticus]
MRVLVIEDDANLRLALDAALRSAGFAVDGAADLPDVDEALSVHAYDCAVVDRMLPAGDALRYVAARRLAGWRVPVLFLTGRNVPAERVEGLSWGDDFLGKPFAMAELVARVGNLCRRGASAPPVALRHAGIELDAGRWEARRDGRELPLTGKEFAVLRRLLTARGEPVARPELIAAGWDELVPPQSNVLDVVVAQLRRKLGDPPVLLTVRGVGYRLAPAAAAHR